MRRIHKIVNIALIFMLIGAFLCQELYALRVPMNGHERVGKVLKKQEGKVLFPHITEDDIPNILKRDR